MRRRRPSPSQRGYDALHRKLRAQWAKVIAERGWVPCAECGEPVTATMRWDLGHTDDRAGWTGPEHATCNRSKAGRKARAMQTTTVRSWR